MARMTGKRALMEMLKAEGVEYIFGNPGTSETAIMDELESHPELKYILVTQEGVAMGMADAYARATGRPSFVNLHIETGLANGMSLLHNANDGGTPLVLSAGNLDVRELTRGRTDLAGIVRPLTKWSAEATHPQQIPGILRRAFNEAKTPPTGPTFVALSANALDHQSDMDISPSPKGHFRITPDENAVEEAAELLGKASNPIMIVSDKVAESDASTDAVQVAEMIGASVYAARYSEMCFPTSHSQFKGAIKLGFPIGREILSQADVVLMIGKMATSYYMFSEPMMDFAGPNTKFVHIDNNAAHVGSTHPTAVGIVGDPKTSLAVLGTALDATMSGSDKEAVNGRLTVFAEEKKASDEAYQSRLKEDWDLRPMTPYRMMAEVASALPSNTIVVNDAVTTSDALHASLQFDDPGTVYGGRGGALGWGIGGAMGVKLANPDRPVVAVLGDGSAMMTVQGLWTAATFNIPVVYVICNNASYRVLKLNMNIYKDHILKGHSADSRYMGMDFPQGLDIAGMAEAMGVHGSRIEDPSAMAPALKHAMELGKPAVLDVVIDGSV